MKKYAVSTLKRVLHLSGLMVMVVAVMYACLYAQENRAERDKAVECLNKKGEVYFKFFNSDRALLNKLTDIISLDNANANEVYAYANPREFERFREFNLYYEVQTHPGDLIKNPTMTDDPAVLRQSWNAYPTLAAYYTTMTDFEKNYPDKCKIIQIGTSTKGRKLLYAKVSDKVNEVEAEPRFMYTSAIHGDELAMYVNFLRLIDYLLKNYDTDAYIKKLVDNIEIWICPLENPDGSYVNSETSVQSAVRYTTNGIDLNRHYPNKEQGAHPDGASKYEPECSAVLKLLDTCQFVCSGNTHGGAELLNYPYDMWSTLHLDDAWMKYVYRAYADMVHKVSSSYLTGQNNGITNGFAWYEIHGSRMDHVTYSRFCKEVTMEMSSTKLISASSIPTYWDYNYKALLYYIEQVLYGINGVVTDSIRGTPVKAKVFVENHDKDSSFTVSKLPNGDYWRPIAAGTYSVTYSAQNYVSRTISNIVVQNEKATVLNVKLYPTNTGIAGNGLKLGTNGMQVRSNSAGVVDFVIAGGLGKQVTIYSMQGAVVATLPVRNAAQQGFARWDGTTAAGSKAAEGCYIIRAGSGRQQLSSSFLLTR